MEQAEALTEWSAEGVYALIVSTCEAAGVNMGKLAQPIRILLSGGAVSPPIDLTLELLGREESLSRIQKGIEVLQP